MQPICEAANASVHCHVCGKRLNRLAHETCPTEQHGEELQTIGAAKCSDATSRHESDDDEPYTVSLDVFLPRSKYTHSPLFGKEKRFIPLWRFLDEDERFRQGIPDNPYVETMMDVERRAPNFRYQTINLAHDNRVNSDLTFTLLHRPSIDFPDFNGHHATTLMHEPQAIRCCRPHQNGKILADFDDVTFAAHMTPHEHLSLRVDKYLRRKLRLDISLNKARWFCCFAWRKRRLILPKELLMHVVSFLPRVRPTIYDSPDYSFMLHHILCTDSVSRDPEARQRAVQAMRFCREEVIERASSYCEHCQKDVYWNPAEFTLHEFHQIHLLSCDRVPRNLLRIEAPCIGRFRHDHDMCGETPKFVLLTNLHELFQQSRLINFDRIVVLINHVDFARNANSRAHERNGLRIDVTGPWYDEAVSRHRNFPFMTHFPTNQQLKTLRRPTIIYAPPCSGKSTFQNSLPFYVKCLDSDDCLADHGCDERADYNRTTLLIGDTCNAVRGRCNEMLPGKYLIDVGDRLEPVCEFAETGSTYLGWWRSNANFRQSGVGYVRDLTRENLHPHPGPLPNVYPVFAGFNQDVSIAVQNIRLALLWIDLTRCGDIHKNPGPLAVRRRPNDFKDDDAQQVICGMTMNLQEIVENWFFHEIFFVKVHPSVPNMSDLQQQKRIFRYVFGEAFYRDRSFVQSSHPLTAGAMAVCFEIPIDPRSDGVDTVVYWLHFKCHSNIVGLDFRPFFCTPTPFAQVFDCYKVFYPTEIPTQAIKQEMGKDISIIEIARIHGPSNLWFYAYVRRGRLNVGRVQFMLTFIKFCVLMGKQLFIFCEQDRRPRIKAVNLLAVSFTPVTSIPLPTAVVPPVAPPIAIGIPPATLPIAVVPPAPMATPAALLAAFPMTPVPIVTPPTPVPIIPAPSIVNCKCFSCRYPLALMVLRKMRNPISDFNQTIAFGYALIMKGFDLQREAHNWTKYQVSSLLRISNGEKVLPRRRQNRSLWFDALLLALALGLVLYRKLRQKFHTKVSHPSPSVALPDGLKVLESNSDCTFAHRLAMAVCKFQSKRRLHHREHLPIHVEQYRTHDSTRVILEDRGDRVEFSTHYGPGPAFLAFSGFEDFIDRRGVRFYVDRPTKMFAAIPISDMLGMQIVECDHISHVVSVIPNEFVSSCLQVGSCCEISYSISEFIDTNPILARAAFGTGGLQSELFVDGYHYCSRPIFRQWFINFLNSLMELLAPPCYFKQIRNCLCEASPEGEYSFLGSAQNYPLPAAATRYLHAITPANNTEAALSSRLNLLRNNLEREEKIILTPQQCLTARLVLARSASIISTPIGNARVDRLPFRPREIVAGHCEVCARDYRTRSHECQNGRNCLCGARLMVTLVMGERRTFCGLCNQLAASKDLVLEMVTMKKFESSLPRIYPVRPFVLPSVAANKMAEIETQVGPDGKPLVQIRQIQRCPDVDCQRTFLYGLCFLRYVPIVTNICEPSLKSTIFGRMFRSVPQPDAYGKALIAQYLPIFCADFVPNYVGPMPINEWLAHFPRSRQEELKIAIRSFADEPLNRKDVERKIFVKIEKLVKDLDEGYAGRGISSVSHRAQCKLGPVIQGYAKQVKQSWNTQNKVVFATGLSADQIGTMIERWVNEGFTNFIDGDYAKFDATVSQDLLKTEQCFYRYAGITSSSAWFVLRHQIRYVATVKVGNQPIYTIRCIGRRNSGDPNTSLGNSMLNAFLVTLALRLICYTEYRLAVCGDDVLLATPSPMNSQQISNISQIIACTGCQLELFQRERLEFVNFLGGHPLRAIQSGQPTITFVPEMIRFLTKSGWAIDEQVRFMEWNRGVMLGWKPLLSCVPIARAVVARVLALTEGLKPKKLNLSEKPQILLNFTPSTTPCTMSFQTVEGFCARYQISQKDIEELERLISLSDLPSIITHPVLGVMLNL